MTGRERVGAAMHLGVPDRVPVMCQLAIGHYFLQSGVDPLDIWFTTLGFADALLRLQRRYRFDGILVNLPGRSPEWRHHVRTIERRGAERIVHWRNGWRTVVPPDDLPRVFRAGGSRPRVPFDAVDPDDLFYVEPHDIAGPSYPYAPGFEGRLRAFPPYQFDTLRRVRAAAPDVSVHGEVFSPFTQVFELADHTAVLMALITDPGRVHACLNALVEGTIALAHGQIAAGADAVLMSSAFAGAGFISPAHYREFVLPYEARVIAGIQAAAAGVPVYTHTCGAIGDRLELMMETGTNGIDTLDPPPLGSVDLADACRRTKGRLFLKGNIDPVNTMLRGSREEVREAARERLQVAGPGGGYILSTACAVPPGAPPANVAVLADVVEE